MCCACTPTPKMLARFAVMTSKQRSSKPSANSLRWLWLHQRTSYLQRSSGYFTMVLSAQEQLGRQRTLVETPRFDNNFRLGTLYVSCLNNQQGPTRKRRPSFYSIFVIPTMQTLHQQLPLRLHHQLFLLILSCMCSLEVLLLSYLLYQLQALLF